jgi:hypothetical protein
MNIDISILATDFEPIDGQYYLYIDNISGTLINIDIWF